MKAVMPVIVFALVAVGCGPEAEAPATQTPTPFATASAGGLTVEASSARPLAVGQNVIAYRITRDGAPVTRAHVVQHPLMTMPMKQHGCPTIEPGDADEDGAFSGTVIFTMPSGDEGHWDLALAITPEGGDEVTVTFESLSVADSTARKSLTVDGVNTIFTIAFAGGAPGVGRNEYTVSAHRASDAGMMRFEPVTDLTLTATPEMPSMGHGSSGNVDPVHRADGLYEGVASFSMAGDWALHVDVTAGGAEAGRISWTWAL